jgi:hypothetical protein
VTVPYVLMAGGRGARMQKHSMGTSKLLFPVDGRPLLGQLLHRLADADITEVFVVTGYRHEDVRDFVDAERDCFPGTTITVVRDEDQPGTQRALAAVRPFLADREFVILDAATLLSPTYLARFASEAVGVVSVGLTSQIALAWHHSLAAVTADDVVRSWWLETEPPAPIGAAERYGRNIGILKVGPSWWALEGNSTAHVLRDVINGNLLGDVAAIWDDGSFRHFGTPREYGIVESDQLMNR